ncbi:MAG: nucleotidyl transferase AbiEii/AbiGii toxin family protein [Acidimicrobiales bacterium]
MTALTLAERVTAIHRALAKVPHAFGGALALAYYAEPRATIDIDLNVFIPPARFDEVARPLRRLGVETAAPQVEELVRRDGQVRVMWDATPVDLFFAYDAFHDAAAASRREVPFARGTIPILGLEHLLVCKIVFNRAKDWVDIDAMLAIEAGLDGDIDVAEVLRWVGRIAGDDDQRYERAVALLTRR